ncbi:MAG: D-2-hydroxyacid dehydrogenase [Acholeplasmataceae bacterium]|nr:D-2-hydroxyacid dehydrogenase [Acholeplasmataceae bacterium]
MKIWLDTWTLKEKYYKELFEKYPEHQFSTVMEDSYDADIIICMPGFVTKENLDNFHKLKWIQLLTAGYNTIDLEYIKNRNILLTYAKDVFSIQIAEDVFSKILYFNRNIGIYHDQIKSGLWKHTQVLHEICHSTVGIIGAGSIGTEIAKRMKSFDAKVIGYRRSKGEHEFYDVMYRDRKGFEKLLKTSDYIIISIPLNKETYHLIGVNEFKMMKSTAILINVARGEIIDQKALIEALENKKIRGAGLDVTTPEPLPENDLLWSTRNVFITPHNSSASPYVHQRLMDEVSDTLDRYINHLELDNIVKL